nr:PREDICTED: protein FAM47E-like [Struthio camelus australis]
MPGQMSQSALRAALDKRVNCFAITTQAGHRFRPRAPRKACAPEAAEQATVRKSQGEYGRQLTGRYCRGFALGITTHSTFDICKSPFPRKGRCANCFPSRPPYFTKGRYKGKLSSRCFPAHSTKHRFSDSLNSQRWRFLKSGLDDFRNGFPPPCDNIIIRSTKGLSPIVLQSRSHLAHQKARKISAKPDCKLTSKQEAQKDFSEETDHNLSQHPQSFYSHLKDSIFPELLLEVMNTLEAEMHKSCRAVKSDHEEEVLPPPKIWRYPKDQHQTEATPGSSAHKESSRNNLHTQLLKTEVEKREKVPRPSYIPPVDINTKPAARESCVWDASREPGQPKFVKIRYGAWYLDPKTWKKQKVGEPLMDPKETGDSVKNFTTPSVKKENPKYYGMHAFKEFLERKGYRKPGILGEEEAEATDDEPAR